MVDVLSVASERTPLRFKRIVVIGGGCYGSWYTQQLTRASERQALIADEVVVVDRNPACLVVQRQAEGQYNALALRVVRQDWNGYLAEWLRAGSDALVGHAMVPSPLMPHLCLDWLIAQAHSEWPNREVSVQPLPAVPHMPWERAAPDGRHYVSFAMWMCPVNCIEPARCPATKGPRDWSMPPAITAYAEAQRDTLDAALIFHCTHRTYGVGMINADDIARAGETVRGYPRDVPQRLLVGTVSHCHGALGVLAIS